MEKDIVSNNFFSDNERFADIINGIGCGGKTFVQGKDLQELDSRVRLGRLRRFGRNQKKRKNLYRDLVRKTPFKINFAIIGIENQEEIDYSLPVRIMSYDVGGYENQVAQIRNSVRRNPKGLSTGEYLYGFKKGSRLYPTVTFALYYGEEDWDGATDIHGLLDFTDIPEMLREKISNYQIHVIEVRKLKDTSMFKTDVRQVFDFFRFAKDKKKLKELTATDENYAYLNEDAYELLEAYDGEEGVFKIKEKYKKGGKVDMCQGLREWIEDERMEGQKEGENRFISLTEKLLKDGRMEDLLRAMKDKEYREQLYSDYRIL